MRLAFYACLLAAITFFWWTVGFMIDYFITFNAGAGATVVIMFAFCIASVFAAVGISRWEDAR